MMSLPSASGELFSIFIVCLHMMQFIRPMSGLLIVIQMMPFRCLGLQKNVLRPFQFSESFVRTKFPLTSDPGCLYVAPSPLHFFAFSPSSTSRRIKSVCDASQSFSMESSVCLPCDVPQKWFGLEPRQ
jgi:hypothetical protein